MQTDRRLSDRVAIVTGAGRGIGAAAGRTLAGAGARVALCDIELELARQTAAAIGDNATAFGHDVSVPANCDRLVADTKAAFGRVDVLVNCAAICPRTAIEDMTEEDYDGIMNTNLKSTFFLSRAAGDAMCEHGWGRIVNVASIGGRTGGMVRATVYSASKAGVISMTKAFARHFAPHGILVNSIAPGAVDTRMMQNISEEALQQHLDAVPLSRLSKPEEQAAVVLFLASDAVSYMTGATIDVNGGALMPD